MPYASMGPDDLFLVDRYSMFHYLFIFWYLTRYGHLFYFHYFQDFFWYQNV